MPILSTHTVEDALIQWEEDIHIYEQSSGQRVIDEANIAVCLNQMAGPTQEHLRLNAGVTDRCQQTRNLILNYTRSKQQFGPTPMDIGHVG